MSQQIATTSSQTNPFLSGLGSVWGSITGGISNVIDGAVNYWQQAWQGMPTYAIPPSPGYLAPSQPTPSQTPAPPPNQGTINNPSMGISTPVLIAGGIGALLLVLALARK